MKFIKMNGTAVIKRNSLQKFEGSKLAARLPERVENMLAKIVEGDKLSIDNIFNLTVEEKKIIEAVLTAGYLTLAGNDRDTFIQKTENVLSDSSRNEIWERNHQCILN